MHRKGPLWSEIEVDLERGMITYRGIRYMLVRVETLTELARSLEADAGRERVSESLARSASLGGGASIRTYREKFGLSDRDLVEFTCAMGRSLGWGGLTLRTMSESEIVIDVTDSPFASGCGKSDHPVCHMTRGVVDALASALFDTRPETHETRCAAMGDPVCVFRSRKSG